MSSHHVVREKQEPALLVLGLDNFSDELLGQLLEWSPTVIIANSIAEKLNVYNIKIDYLIGNDTVEVLQSDVIQVYSGDDSIVRSALTFLVDNRYPSVNIVADSLNIHEIKPFVTLISVVVFYARKKIYPVNSGFSKWLPAAAHIQILSPASDLQFTGLQPAGHQQYTTITDGLFTLSFNDAFIFIAEEI